LTSLEQARDWLAQSTALAVLTGAGISAESGVPTFRGAEGLWKNYKPEDLATPEAFARDPKLVWEWYDVRRQAIAKAVPNAAHRALVQLEIRKPRFTLITQNVDGLHDAAGSRRVVELHGSLAAVRCLECGERIARTAFQQRILELNAEWERHLEPVEHEAAPDGDVELPASALAHFCVPTCDACGTGVLKPDVVFFGENVPRPRLEEAWRVFNDGDVLLVIGSSLTVYSGRRFIYRAGEIGMPIAVMNVGPTRADDVAAVKMEAPLGAALPAVAALLVRELAR